MATTVSQLATSIQRILIDEADIVARDTGFIRRQRKFRGSTFLQTLLFGWWSAPNATLEELAHTANLRGVCVSPQGVDERFTPEAATFLRGMLDFAVTQLVENDPVLIPLLNRFQGVYLLDSTTIVLPAPLAELWPGSGGSASPSSLKLQVRWDVATGRLDGPYLQAGREQDRTSPFQQAPLPVGSLRVADLGFFAMDALREQNTHGAYWLTRVRAGTVVWDAQEHSEDLLRFLQRHGPQNEGETGEFSVGLGRESRLPCRLLVVRLPQAVVAQRCARIRADAHRRQQKPTQGQLELAKWTILATNAPPEKMSLPEALVLARLRWQIELLFKLWKTHGSLDESRSKNPWRILCEVYAKLLVLLIQHWVLLLSCWEYPNRSLVKAAQTIRKYVYYLAAVLETDSLCEALRLIQRALTVGCRLNKRKTKPNTYQLLLDASLT